MLLNYKVDIVTLQEIRWMRQGVWRRGTNVCRTAAKTVNMNLNAAS
jgi:transposase